MEIKYQHFTVECALNEPVTVDNFWKHSITICSNGTPDNPHGDVTTVPKEILCMYDTESLLSGDEDRARQGLKNVIRNMRWSIEKLESLTKRFE